MIVLILSLVLVSGPLVSGQSLPSWVATSPPQAPAWLGVGEFVFSPKPSRLRRLKGGGKLLTRVSQSDAVFLRPASAGGPFAFATGLDAVLGVSQTYGSGSDGALLMVGPTGGTGGTAGVTFAVRRFEVDAAGAPLPATGTTTITFPAVLPGAVYSVVAEVGSSYYLLDSKNGRVRRFLDVDEDGTPETLDPLLDFPLPTLTSAPNDPSAAVEFHARAMGPDPQGYFDVLFVGKRGKPGRKEYGLRFDGSSWHLESRSTLADPGSWVGGRFLGGVRAGQDRVCIAGPAGLVFSVVQTVGGVATTLSSAVTTMGQDQPVVVPLTAALDPDGMVYLEAAGVQGAPRAVGPAGPVVFASTITTLAAGQSTVLEGANLHLVTSANFRTFGGLGGATTTAVGIVSATPHALTLSIPSGTPSAFGVLSLGTAVTASGPAYPRLAVIQ